MTVLIDSSAWIEFFGFGKNAKKFLKYIEKARPESHVTSAIVLYEVYKSVKGKAGEKQALQKIGDITNNTTVIDVSSKIALAAADKSLELGLAMADAIILATARSLGATLVTGDKDFKGLPDVVYIGK